MVLSLQVVDLLMIGKILSFITKLPIYFCRVLNQFWRFQICQQKWWVEIRAEAMRSHNWARKRRPWSRYHEIRRCLENATMCACYGLATFSRHWPNECETFWYMDNFECESWSSSDETFWAKVWYTIWTLVGLKVKVLMRPFGLIVESWKFIVKVPMRPFGQIVESWKLKVESSDEAFWA